MSPEPIVAGWGFLAARTSGSANNITPGLLGFLVIAGMGVALFFLLRSMTKHLRRVREVRDAGLQPGSKIAANVGGAARTDGPGRGAAGSDGAGGGTEGGGTAGGSAEGGETSGGGWPG